MKIEETAKLRQELKDLKEIANLSKELKETHAEMRSGRSSCRKFCKEESY